jgi:hypothetical protein
MTIDVSHRLSGLYLAFLDIVLIMCTLTVSSRWNMAHTT